MGSKLGRNYILQIQDLGSELKPGSNSIITISLPFTLKFNITRGMWGSPSSAILQVYNLNENTRSFIRKDENDWGFVKMVTLMAGYGDDLAVILRGSVHKAYSERNGVDYVTSIEVFDGGAAFINAQFGGQFKSGTQSSYVLKAIAKSLEPYGVDIGAVSKNYERTIKRGNSYSGNSMDLISEISGGGAFIDNSKLNILTDDEYLDGDTLTVSSQTGLLGVPKREWNNVTFTMLMESRAYLNQLVVIDIGKKEFDGQYKIRNITHAGTISETIGESATTTINCITAKGNLGVRFG